MCLTNDFVVVGLQGAEDKPSHRAVGCKHHEDGRSGSYSLHERPAVQSGRLGSVEEAQKLHWRLRSVVSRFSTIMSMADDGFLVIWIDTK